MPPKLSSYSEEYRKDYMSRYYQDHKEGAKIYNKNYRQSQTGKFGECKKGAKQRGIKFELTRAQFDHLTIGTCCSYCGAKDVGVDRLDSKLWYCVDNCVACCYACNVAKSTMSLEEFKTWIRNVYSFMRLGC